VRITEATLAAPHPLGPGDRSVMARRDDTRAKFAVRSSDSPSRIRAPSRSRVGPVTRVHRHATDIPSGAPRAASA
jgi:hypothetical protein